MNVQASGKETIKRILGQIPFTAELYWLVRQRGNPIQTRFSLKKLQTMLPEMIAEVNALRPGKPTGKKVFFFASLHYWIEHAALLGLAYAAQGHKVALGYLPYAEWQTPINRFDLRRQNVYAGRVLSMAAPVMDAVSFLNLRYLSSVRILFI